MAGIGSGAVAPLACAPEKFVAVVAAVAVVVALVAVPVVERVAERRPLRPRWGLGAVARGGRVKARATRAGARAEVRARRGSGAAWVGSRRPARRRPTACPEGLAPRHLCRGRTVLSCLKTNEINFTTAGE